MRPSAALCALAALAVSLGACSDDAPPSESAALELVFEVRSNDVDGDGTVSDSISIASQTGDPWAAFITAARATLGADPSDITVEDVRLVLDPSSVNVVDLAEIFHGPVGLDLRIDGSGNRYDVAEGLLDADAIGTEATLSPRFRYGDVVDDDRAAVLAGSFDALFVGQTGAEFRTLSATATLVVNATFVAVSE